MKEKDPLWSLLAKRMTSETTNEELHTLNELMKVHFFTSSLVQILSELLKPPVVSQAADQEAQKAFESHLHRMNAKGMDISLDDHTGPGQANV